MEFRESLRTARRARGLSLERCAQELGISTSTLIRWEQGKSEPSPLALEKLRAMGGTWVCSVCRKPIVPGGGYVVICDAESGGYPRRATPDEQPGAIKFDAMHASCDPTADTGSEYWIGVERAETLEAWVGWVLHVSTKVWMGKRDLRRMLRFWYLNRGQQEARP